jgi:CheY-like chemotaxis protein
VNEREARPLVLIVEDEEPIAEALALIVEDAGYAVVIAGHGLAALERVRGGDRPALLITDLMMPRMDGAALIGALRASMGPEMPPVVLMTAVGSHYVDRVKADAVLPKPFDLKEVEHLLERFLPHE